MSEIRTLTLSPSLDLGAAVEKLEPFAKLRSSVAYREPGGGGVNVSRAIRKVGGCTRAVFAGDAQVGVRLGRLLDEEEVPNVRVPCGSATRENFSVWVERARENYHFVMPGGALSEREAQACFDALLDNEGGSAPAWIVASGALPTGVPVDYYARLARAAAQRGIPIVLDTHGEPLRRALGEPVYLIKPNLEEFWELVGADADPHLPLDEGKLIRQARELIDRCHIENLIITLGEGGALLVTRAEHVRAVAPRVRPVSPVGAGDSFLGVCIHALTTGLPLQDALYRGIAAGASAARTPASNLFRPEEIDELAARTRELSARFL